MWMACHVKRKMNDTYFHCQIINSTSVSWPKAVDSIGEVEWTKPIWRRCIRNRLYKKWVDTLACQNKTVKCASGCEYYIFIFFLLTLSHLAIQGSNHANPHSYKQNKQKNKLTKKEKRKQEWWLVTFCLWQCFFFMANLIRDCPIELFWAFV